MFLFSLLCWCSTFYDVYDYFIRILQSTVDSFSFCRLLSMPFSMLLLNVMRNKRTNAHRTLIVGFIHIFMMLVYVYGFRSLFIWMNVPWKLGNKKTPEVIIKSENELSTSKRWDIQYTPLIDSTIEATAVSTRSNNDTLTHIFTLRIADAGREESKQEERERGREPTSFKIKF